MTRRALAAVLCAVLALGPAALPTAFAQDKGKGKDKDGQNGGGKKKEKDPKDTPEWKTCASIGASFQAKDSGGLVARMRSDGKLKLALDETSGDFEKDQAGPNLDKWFKGKTDFVVEMQKIDGLEGTLKLTYRLEKGNKSTQKSLVIKLQKKDKGEGFFLTKIELV